MRKAGKRPLQARAAERNRRVQFNMQIGQEEAPVQRDLVQALDDNGVRRGEFPDRPAGPFDRSGMMR